MQNYTTAEVAKIINVHPNTILLYEKWGYIHGIERKTNGYRIFTDRHIEQIRIIRIASKSEFVKCEIRIKAVEIITLAATGDLEGALKESKKYLEFIQAEKDNDLALLKKILIRINNTKFKEDNSYLKTNEVAKIIGVTNDTIIYWERNGVITVKRNKKNRYRIYSEKDVALLKVIKALRDSKYCVSAISKMINKVKFNNGKTLSEMIYLEDLNYNFINEVDKLVKSLVETEINTKELIEYIETLKN